MRLRLLIYLCREFDSGHEHRKVGVLEERSKLDGVLYVRHHDVELF